MTLLSRACRIPAILILALACLGTVGAADVPAPIRTEPGAFDAAEAHVQGICCDENAIYVTFKNYVYKLDWQGKVLRAVEAKVHAGDPCVADGKLVVAMSRDDAKAINEYDLDLNLLREIELEKCPGCDGAALLDGRLFFGGPSLRETHTTNTLKVYDAKYNYVKDVPIDFGVPTSYGFQSMTASESLGLIFAAFYLDAKAAPKDAPRSIWFDKEFNIVGTTRLDAGNGWTIAPPSRQPGGETTRFLVARTEKADGKMIGVFYWYDFDGKDFRPVVAEEQ